MWSRAAQLQLQSSCRCRLCLHTGANLGNTLIRRSTTAASRRRASAADLFTACYTTILGSAAIIDAHRKDAKRKELDRRLEQARAVSTSTTPSTQPDDPLNDNFEEIFAPYSSRSNGPNGPNLYWRQPPSYQSKTESSLLQELAAFCNITRNPSGRSSWMQDQIDWVRVEASIVAEEHDPEIVLREPKDPDQMQRTTDTITQLVDDLLTQLGTHRSDSTESADDAAQQNAQVGKTIIQELDDVRWSLYYPSYRKSQQDPEGSRRFRAFLSDAVRRIFNHATDPVEAVGRICYNLLISEYSPTMHTYNAMIAGFNRIHRPDLAQVVINSYIQHTAWPATQQTMVCLLYHYRATNDIQGLRDVVARMRGVRDTGFNFCIVNKERIYTYDWLEWASKYCASRKYAFVERAHRGSEVFDGIIRGWLHHGDVTAASMTFIACVRSGSFIPIQTLYQLFAACLAAVDHSTARQMIRGIVKNLQNFYKMINHIIRQSTAAMSLRVLDCLSKLVHICGLPLYDAPDVVDKSYAKSLWRLKYIIGSTRIQLELHISDRLCRRVFDTIESDNPWLTRLDGAIKIVNAAQSDRKTFENYGVVAHLLSVDKRVHDLEKKTRALASQAKAVILELAAGLSFDPASLLAKEKHDKPHRQNHYYALRDALASVDLSAGPLTQREIKSQLVQRIPNPQVARRLRLAGQWENMCPKVLASFYAPGAVDPFKPENAGYSYSVRKVELQLADSEDFIRAILFSFLGTDRQKWMRHSFPWWYAMPLEPLVEYHLRRLAPGQKPQAKAGSKHPDTTAKTMTAPDISRGVLPAPAARETADADRSSLPPPLLRLHVPLRRNGLDFLERDW